MEENFKSLRAMKIQVEVFWVVTPCSDVVGYRRFGGQCCYTTSQRKTLPEYFYSFEIGMYVVDSLYSNLATSYKFPNNRQYVLQEISKEIYKRFLRGYIMNMYKFNAQEEIAFVKTKIHNQGA
jgi:hypothetical protein